MKLKEDLEKAIQKQKEEAAALELAKKKEQEN